jgi:hypothetical protein
MSLLSYTQIAAGYLELARPIADNDAAKPSSPATESASNSLSTTIHAAINDTFRLLTQEIS